MKRDNLKRANELDKLIREGVAIIDAIGVVDTLAFYKDRQWLYSLPIDDDEQIEKFNTLTSDFRDNLLQLYIEKVQELEKEFELL